IRCHGVALGRRIHNFLYEIGRLWPPGRLRCRPLVRRQCSPEGAWITTLDTVTVDSATVDTAPALATPAVRLDVRPLTVRIGAEISGVRISGDLDAATVAAIRAAILRHRVVFFRDQAHLTPRTQVEFARLLGELTQAHPTQTALAGHPLIHELDASRGGRAGAWHTDVTFTDRPPAFCAPGDRRRHHPGRQGRSPQPLARRRRQRVLAHRHRPDGLSDAAAAERGSRRAPPPLVGARPLTSIQEAARQPSQRGTPESSRSSSASRKAVPAGSRRAAARACRRCQVPACQASARASASVPAAASTWISPPMPPTTRQLACVGRPGRSATVSRVCSTYGVPSGARPLVTTSAGSARTGNSASAVASGTPST